MSGDKDLIYLAHIAQCIEAIKTYTVQGKNEEFLHNSLVQDAVLRRLQIMAESSQRLSDKLKAKAPVDWKALSGFRNILVHDYLGGISLERVWNAIANDLPVLKEQVDLMVNYPDSLR